MSHLRAFLVAFVVAMLAVGITAWLVLRGSMDSWLAPDPIVPPAAEVPVADSTGPHIKARLFYVAEDGAHLVSVERDVPYSNQTAEQARVILQAQIEAVEAPLVSAIPAATQLRAVYITPQGEAYVDLSQDVSTAHPGGTLNELLTIYTVVHALTVNLPAVTAVQILVDGREVDTLAGHVDLRRPLATHLQLVAGP